MDNKLLNQPVLVNVVDNEMEALLEEMQLIYDSVFDDPFDIAIEEAVTKRGCLYVDQYQPLAN